MQALPRRIRPLIAALGMALAALALTAPLAAAERARAPGGASASSASATAEALRFWTPERMRNARPLDLVLDRRGRSRLRVGRQPAPGAATNFHPVETPRELPYAVNGRVFIRQGKLTGFCSATAIDSPTRQLVLTAGHCVNSGPEGRRGRSTWFRNILFVPAYTGRTAPFGAFVARGNHVYAPRQWVRHGNVDFDLGAFLVRPNKEGVEVADAVGGGARIVLGKTRRQRFQTFGYPGRSTRMQGCASSFAGDDRLTYPLPGPPTLGIRCRWAPGASGGGWLVGDGSEINGVNSYLHLRDKSKTYGPYFSEETVGRLVRGL